MSIEVPKGTTILTSIHTSGSKYGDEIIIPDGIEEISSYLFFDCWVKKLVLPKTLKKIGSSAFYKCTNLKEVILPEGLEDVEDDAFWGCYNLKYVSFPSTLKKIGSSAFYKCTNLKEVILPEGLEDVEDDAFSGCYNLKYVSLPSTLKKIGDHAFATSSIEVETTGIGRSKTYTSRTFESQIKYVFLPKNIEQIGENAFGWKHNYQYKRRRYLFASKKSNVKKCAENAGFSLKDADLFDGAIIGGSDWDCALYDVGNNSSATQMLSDIKKLVPYVFFDHKTAKEIMIPNFVTAISANKFQECKSLEYVVFEEGSKLETIPERAFFGCEQIKEIIISDSVTEIGANAFLGCIKLSSLTFSSKSKLKRIGSKAFASFAGKIVDLPASVVEIADDVLPKNCIVSIGGEMPYYDSRLSRLKEQKETIDAKKKRVEDLEVQLEEAKARLEEHIASLPSKFDGIPGFREEIKRIEELRDVERSFNDDERNYLNKRIADVESKIKQLQAERKDCFFLAFTKKRELDEDIARRQSELQSIRDDLQKISNKSRDDEKRFADLIALIQRNLDTLLGEQKRWNDNKSYLTQIRDGIEKEIKVLSEEIVKLSAKLKEDEETLEKEHDKWIKAKEKALRQIEREKQEAEKEKIISEIGIPVCSTIPLFEYNHRDAVVDERLLNEALLGMIADLNKEKRATTHNRHVEANSAKIERVKEINVLLGYERDRDIMGFAPLPMQEIADTYIPERVSVLCEFFAKSEYWSKFKHAAVDIHKKKNAKANIHDKFFQGLDYFAFEYEERYLLMLPYCMVIFEAKKPMVVLTYNKADFAVKYTDKEEIRDDIPPFGELIHERHKHINADGSVSRRYKDNPIIKTIRYTTVTIKVDNHSFTFPTKTQDEAMQFENAFNSYRKVLTTGLAGNVYSLVENSREHSEIVEALNNLAKEEARLRELEKQREAEEKRRLEEERIAAEKAAEERKKAIIQRQRELNEERKREAEKLAEERRRVVKLFDDDFEVDTANVVTEEADNATIPIEIVGNRLISNNVFKVTLKFVEEFKPESLIVYFVTNSGETISNKKKISVTTDDITIGFVLNSGIDYTTMQECLMRFESQGDILWNIDFKMNISFYSDF